jgi:sensor histidine kinase YesM
MLRENLDTTIAPNEQTNAPFTRATPPQAHRAENRGEIELCEWLPLDVLHPSGFILCHYLFIEAWILHLLILILLVIVIILIVINSSSSSSSSRHLILQYTSFSNLIRGRYHSTLFPAASRCQQVILLNSR